MKNASETIQKGNLQSLPRQDASFGSRLEGTQSQGSATKNFGETDSTQGKSTQGKSTMGKPEIAQLLEKAQGGEGDALNHLFSRYNGRMLDLARRRLGNRLLRKEDPEDLAQTTFREAARDFKQYEYRGERSFFHWLSRILQNKIRDKAEFYSAAKRDLSKESSLERSVKGADSDLPAYDPPSAELSVTQVVQRDEQFAILREQLEELSDLHRQAIELVYFEGLPLREAGRRMDGRTEDAVRMLVRRATDRLREISRVQSN